MTTRPRWATALLRALAPERQAEDVLGDLEEAHRLRARRHGPLAARALTALETLDMAAALVRARFVGFRTNKGSSMLQDYRLGVRMLAKYPGLTFAGGLALAIAIGIGAGWYSLAGNLFRPTIPLPNGDRIVEVEMRDAAGSQDERRLLHDFVTWRREVRLIEDLGAYRTLERNLVLGSARPEPVTVAETTASAFRVASVPPLLGRPLLDADEEPGAHPVAVLGYDLWQRRFGARSNVVGETLQLGRDTTTIVGVMPEGFAFPVNHRLWVPMQLRRSGYAPLGGPGVRIFGRLAAGATQAQAYVEVTALTEREAAASPRTHEHLRPRVLAYGGESPGDRSPFELALTHIPILLVLLVACANVGTLIYARTATREAEIAMRYALGATRGRIISQLFVEALVLAAVAAAVGLVFADAALKFGLNAFHSAQGGALPFWVDPGLKLKTVLYAAGLTAIGAAILGVLPAIEVTRAHVQGQLKNLGAGGSTLRFGGVWTTAMIAQVAFTAICLPPAMGITWESMRDRMIRGKFPANQYLAVRIGLDRDATAAPSGQDADAAFEQRTERVYGEFERRIAQEPGVVAITFADRLPGMQPSVRHAEVEASAGAAPIAVDDMWRTTVGPGYFEAFDKPIVAGRDFHDGDRTPGARTVIVNEAFAHRFMTGASPVGRRVRDASGNPAAQQPWFEIVGMVRDMGMTPTDLGEAPYVFHPATRTTLRPAVMGVRVSGDPSALAPRVRAIAAALDPGLRLDDVQRLDALAWKVDVPQMVVAGALASIVSLGLFLSAAGIFSLMSVSVARRTREIGLRSALGASQGRLLAGIFSRAAVLVGSGIVAGNLVLLLVVMLQDEVTIWDVADALLTTSALMLTVGLLACVEPARRALRIHPTDALKEA